MKTNTTKKRLFITFVIGAIAVLSVFAVLRLRSPRVDNQQSKSESNQQENQYVNLNPPSEAEKNAATATKDEIINRSPSESRNSSNVSPIISTWGQNESNNLEVSGFVPGIIENDGKCTLVLEKDGEKVTTKKTARSDAQSTVCGLFEVSVSQLAKGVWRASLTYSSSKYGGTSATVDMEVK